MKNFYNEERLNELNDLNKMKAVQKNFNFLKLLCDWQRVSN